MGDVALFKTKDCSQPKRVRTAYRGGKKPRKLKMQNPSEKNIIKNVRNIFKLQKENKTIKDIIIRDIKILFEKQEEDYYKPVRVGNF